MDKDMNSVDPLNDMNKGARKILNGSVEVVNGLLLDLYRSSKILVGKNVVAIQIYLLLSIMITLITALLCFAGISLLITEYGYKTWESALLLAIFLLVITVVIFALYKLFQKNKNSFAPLSNNLIIKLRNNDIEEGATEVLSSLRKIFSFEELVGRNPFHSLTLAGFLGISLGYLLSGKNNKESQADIVDINNQETSQTPKKNKNINNNATNTSLQKSKTQSTGLPTMLFKMALPFLLPAIEKKISCAVDNFLNNKVSMDKGLPDLPEQSHSEK